jgi:hypothetical protein
MTPSQPAGPDMMTRSQHVYEVRPRKDPRGVDLISESLPFGRLWYSEPNAVENAIGYAKHRSRSHDAVIRMYDESGNVIETHEHGGRLQRTVSCHMFGQSFAIWLDYSYDHPYYSGTSGDKKTEAIG